MNIELYRYSDEEVEVEVTQIPSAAYMVKAWMAVKVFSNDDDDDSLILRTITGTANADGQITDDGSGGTGMLLFLFPNDSFNAILESSYSFGVKVRMQNNKVHALPLAKGNVRVINPGVSSVA